MKDEVIAPAEAPADSISDQVLTLVAGKTGYPPDMLEPDLDLEADLGIDTVKQAETFAAIREMFDIPRLENLKLRDYPTLAHVIGFVKQMRPDLVSPATAEPETPAAGPAVVAAAASPELAGPQSDPIMMQVLQLVAEKTGYPAEMLEPDLDLEADLGIDTVKQAETFVAIRETFDIPRQESLKLRDYPTLGHVVQFVRQMRPDLAAAAVPPAQEDVPIAAPAAAPAQEVVPIAAPAAEPASLAGHGAADPVEAAVLRWSPSKTGYPEEMLELDLDLEADLGVDTVKQAETFLAIREMYRNPAGREPETAGLPHAAARGRFREPDAARPRSFT